MAKHARKCLNCGETMFDYARDKRWCATCLGFMPEELATPPAPSGKRVLQPSEALVALVARAELAEVNS